jgi:hypothetical protein
VHHGCMNQVDEVELATRLLPGVDLTLWMQIIAAVLFVLVVAGVALAVA